MGVQVDQPGGDDFAGDVADIAGLAEVMANGGHPTIGKSDIDDIIHVLCRVDHPPASEQQIEHVSSSKGENERRRTCSLLGKFHATPPQARKLVQNAQRRFHPSAACGARNTQELP